MKPFDHALETSVLLAEKVASARPASADLLMKQALADFATFGLFKRAAIDPHAISALQKGLGWGVGLGVPALGVGHMLMNRAHEHSADILRDARNQALMTAAGVGGMQALGEMLKKRPHPVQHNVNVTAPQPPMPQLEEPQQPLDLEQKLAAHIMVDDVLEDGCNLFVDPAEKHAALVQLIRHRCEGTRLLRGFLP
jgi:hypothetical protein